MRSITPPNSHQSNRRLWFSVIFVVLLLVIGGITFMKRNDNSSGIAKNTSASQATKGEPSTAKSANETNSTEVNSSTSEPGDQKSDSGGASNLTLLEPTGNFISNHHPDSPASETSVCTTTPGASCTIVFTKGSVIKSLPSQTTDRGGSTYWNNWKLSDIGLTSGNWSVQSIATLNGQTKSAVDATALVIQ
jgi:hypothetical protein